MSDGPKSEIDEIPNEDILEANEEVLREASKILAMEDGATEAEISATTMEGEAGRVRAASATTRVFGHFMSEANPRATWAVALMKMEKDPGGDVMRDTIWSRLMKFPRFRSQLVVHRLGGYWRELPEEDLLALRETGYLWSEVLPEGNAETADINAVVNECNSWEYDRLKPLWRVQYCRKMADGGAMLIITVNHAVGDGISLVATMLSTADDAPDFTAKPVRGERKKSAPAADKPVERKPQGPKLSTASKAKSFSYGVFHGVTSSQWAPDKKNSLSMPDVTKPSTTKYVAQAERILLDDMKAVKSKFPGATLNDIMMAVMTATIRAYLVEVGDPIVNNGQLMRGAFPINLRSPHEPVLNKHGDPMNKWAYGNFNFDFSYKSRIELVWKVKRQIDKIKVSPSPLIQHRMAGVLTKTMPKKMLLDSLLNMANLTTAQLSNVPGPATALTIAGVKVEDLCFYLFTPVGLYFGIMSYNGFVSAGVNVDGSVGADPAQIAKHWKSEFDALKGEVDAMGDKPIPVPKW